jgi:hypothetical protein
LLTFEKLMYQRAARLLENYEGCGKLDFERDPGDWEWTYYPKAGVGVKTQGSVKSDRESAVTACKAAMAGP